MYKLHFYGINQNYDYTFTTMTNSTLPLWLANVNSNETAGDMKTIAQTIESLVTDVRADINGVNFFFIYRKAPNPAHLVTILRTTFAIRQKITGWKELCEFTKGYLPTLGINPEKTMKGLI